MKVNFSGSNIKVSKAMYNLVFFLLICSMRGPGFGVIMNHKFIKLRLSTKS